MEQLKNITLHLGDCMDVLKDMPDKSFDLAIVDPPYYSWPERRMFYGCRISNIGVKRLYEKSEKWEVPTTEYFDELQRVAQYYIVWGCNYFDYIFAPGRIVWDKCNGSSGSYSILTATWHIETSSLSVRRTPISIAQLTSTIANIILGGSIWRNE